ncbi:hypothetical protein BJ508DRAFT_316176, partial [Ascobolus immersus RN42]
MSKDEYKELKEKMRAGIEKQHSTSRKRWAKVLAGRHGPSSRVMLERMAIAAKVEPEVKRLQAKHKAIADRQRNDELRRLGAQIEETYMAIVGCRGLPRARSSRGHEAPAVLHSQPEEVNVALANTTSSSTQAGDVNSADAVHYSASSSVLAAASASCIHANDAVVVHSVRESGSGDDAVKTNSAPINTGGSKILSDRDTDIPDCSTSSLSTRTRILLSDGSVGLERMRSSSSRLDSSNGIRASSNKDS